MISKSLFDRYYADPRFKGTPRFFAKVRAAARPEHRVLNLGAGPATRNPVCVLKGEVAEVVGADIADDVLTNPEVDRAVVIKDGKLPFPDGHFDISFADCVLEHVEHPAPFLAETRRVLKPGGSFFFRTPNFHHYVAIIAHLTPHAFHTAVANRIRGLPDDAYEPFPTYYRLNTRAALRRAATEAGFSRVELEMVECEPSYLMFHALPFYAGLAYERAVNSTEALAGMRANIFGQFVK